MGRRIVTKHDYLRLLLSLSLSLSLYLFLTLFFSPFCFSLFTLTHFCNFLLWVTRNHGCHRHRYTPEQTPAIKPRGGQISTTWSHINTQLMKSENCFCNYVFQWRNLLRKQLGMFGNKSGWVRYTVWTLSPIETNRLHAKHCYVFDNLSFKLLFQFNVKTTLSICDSTLIVVVVKQQNLLSNYVTYSWFCW